MNLPKVPQLDNNNKFNVLIITLSEHQHIPNALGFLILKLYTCSVQIDLNSFHLGTYFA